MKLASRLQKLERAITSHKSRLGLCTAFRVLKIDAEDGYMSHLKRERLRNRKNRPEIMTAPPEAEKVWRFVWSFYDEARGDLKEEYYESTEEVIKRYHHLKAKYPSDDAALFYYDPSRRTPPSRKEGTR